MTGSQLTFSMVNSVTETSFHIGPERQELDWLHHGDFIKQPNESAFNQQPCNRICDHGRERSRAVVQRRSLVSRRFCAEQNRPVASGPTHWRPAWPRGSWCPARLLGGSEPASGDSRPLTLRRGEPGGLCGKRGGCYVHPPGLSQQVSPGHQVEMRPPRCPWCLGHHVVYRWPAHVESAGDLVPVPDPQTSTGIPARPGR